MSARENAEGGVPEDPGEEDVLSALPDRSAKKAATAIPTAADPSVRSGSRRTTRTTVTTARPTSEASSAGRTDWVWIQPAVNARVGTAASIAPRHPPMAWARRWRTSPRRSLAPALRHGAQDDLV